MNEDPGDRDPIVRPSRAPAQGRGAAAEALAADFLAGRGLSIVARNVRCRRGEIDLVCLDRGTLVFVEVRLRTGNRFGGAAASITARKRERIVHAARWWLAGAGRRHAARACRFDAVLLDALDHDGLDWIRNAFEADGS